MRNLAQMISKLIVRPEDNFGMLENRLRAALDPVTPNPDFVRNLKHHLLSQWGSLPSLPDTNTPVLILMILALIFSWIMFFVVGLRLIIILGSTIAYLNRRRSQT